jgi:hydrophobe/amphiphile efflux-3 (HAE3) family protein
MNPLETISRFSEQKPYHVIAVILLVTAILGSGILNISMKADMESFLPEDNEAIEATNLFSEEFGGDAYETILLKGDFTSLQGINALQSLVTEIRSEPRLEGFVLSSTSYLDMLMASDTISPPFDETTPQTIAHVLEQDKASDEPRLVGTFVSNGLDATIVLVQVDGDVDQDVAREKVEALRSIVDDFSAADNGLEAGITGTYTQMIDNLDAMSGDNAVLMPLATVFILVVLFIVFRKLSDTLLPYVTIAFALSWILGIMGYAGIPFTAMFVALVPLMLGISVVYAIHILFRYREEARKGKDTLTAINTCVRNTGTAVFISAVTTMFGFSSFFISELPPMREFGYLTVLGILFSFVLVVTLLPALTVLRDRRMGPSVDVASKRALARGVSKALDGIVIAALHHKRPVLGIVAIVTIASIGVAPMVDTTLNWNDMLPEDIESMQVSREMEQYFESSITNRTYMLVQGDALSPEVMAEVARMEQALRSLTLKNDEGELIIGSQYDVRSYVDVYIQANEGLLPTSRQRIDAITQSLMSDQQGMQNLGQHLVIDPGSEHYLQLGVISVTINAESENDMSALSDEMYAIASSDDYSHATYRPAGAPIIMSDLMGGMTETQVRTTILALVLCFLVVSLIHRSAVLGALSVLPVVLTISWEFLLLYTLGWSFDLFTIMISALIVGLGIDFAVHIIQRFKEETASGRNTEDAIHAVVLNVGEALTTATVATAGAFFIIGFSSMPILMRFGVLTGVVLVFSFIAAIIVLPPILAWYSDRGIKKAQA